MMGRSSAAWAGRCDEGHSSTTEEPHLWGSLSCIDLAGAGAGAGAGLTKVTIAPGSYLQLHPVASVDGHVVHALQEVVPWHWKVID